MIGWVLAIVFFCLYLDSKSRISYLDDRIKAINEKYNNLLGEIQNKNSEQNYNVPYENHSDTLKTYSNNASTTPSENHTNNSSFEEKNVSTEMNANQNNYSANNLEERKIKEAMQKNTAILTTGAILIVIAAIVFLTSTWYLISSPLKVGILVLLFGVFLFASKLAKEKLNLPKASKAFFYIAMAYIPICLCSFSVLKLLGDYLSINGPGKYIYFTICSILTGSIYYYYYKKNNSNSLFIGSLICGLGSIILFSLIFSNSITLIISLVVIYNIIQLTVCRIFGKDINKTHDIFLTATSVICYTTYLILVIAEYCKNITIYPEIAQLLTRISSYSDLAMPMIIGIPVISAINSLLHYLSKKEEIYIVPYYIFTYLIPLIFIIEYTMHIASYSYVVAILGTAGILLLIKMINSVIFNYIKSQNDIDNYSLIDLVIFMIANVLLFIYTFILNGNGRIIYLLLSGISLIETISLVVARNNYKIKSTNVLLPISFSIMSFNLFHAIIYGTSTLSYINCHAIYSLFIILIAVYCEKMISDKYYANTFKVISASVSFISVFSGLLILSERTALIPAVLVCFGIFSYIYYKDRKLEFIRAFLYYLGYYILLLAFEMIPGISSASCYATAGVIVSYGIAVYCLMKKDITFDIVFSLIALLSALLNINNIYLKYVITIIWESAYILASKNIGIKRLLVGCLYITTYGLYFHILNGLNLQNYKILYLIGLYAIGILFNKSIIDKYKPNNELVGLGVLFLISPLIYGSSVIDGVICIALMVGTLIFSCIKEYKSLFIYVMMSILVNAILLIAKADILEAFYLITAIGLATYSLINKQVSFETLISFLALLKFATDIDNPYIIYLVSIIWESTYIIASKDNSIKNLFKGCLYITAYLLYVHLLNDFNMQNYKFLYIIGLYIVGIIFSKTIFDKYKTDSEYFVLGLLYLISLFLYRDSIFDGIICVTFMFATLIFSYIKGYGALFICTLISIIVNILMLTRDLWFSMPWWVYLLTIGLALIIFAMRNESKENKKIEIVNSIQSLKERIDKK